MTKAEKIGEHEAVWVRGATVGGNGAHESKSRKARRKAERAEKRVRESGAGAPLRTLWRLR